MKITEAILRSKDLKELQTRQRGIWKRRFIVLALLIPILVAFLVLSLIWKISEATCPEKLFPVQLADYIFRVLKILLDTYMLMTFMQLYCYFYQRKLAHLATHATRFTLFNRFMVAWIPLLATLNMIHSLGYLVKNYLFECSIFET
jgi:hypothetical protein